MKIWVITQRRAGGVDVVAAIEDEIEAELEYAYLAYHGEGYRIAEIETAARAGEYAHADLPS